MKIKSMTKPLIIAGVATAMASVAGVYIAREKNRSPILDIYIFSLKTGRSIFIRTPSDKRILIDAGSSLEVIREITKILPSYSRKIDKIISTDTDSKNVIGLIDIIKRYSVGSVYAPAFTLQSLGISSSTDQIYQTFFDTLKEKDIFPQKISAGDIVYFDDNVSAKILFPVLPSIFEYSKSSPPDIVMSVSFGNVSLSILGNISTKAQKFLAVQGVSTTKGSIVSVSPSGANLSAELIDELRPDILVYTKDPVVKNTPKSNHKLSFSLKSKKVLPDPLLSIPKEGRLSLKENGTIHLVSDGQKLWVADD